MYSQELIQREELGCCAHLTVVETTIKEKRSKYMKPLIKNAPIVEKGGQSRALIEPTLSEPYLTHDGVLMPVPCLYRCGALYEELMENADFLDPNSLKLYFKGSFMTYLYQKRYSWWITKSFVSNLLMKLVFLSGV